MHLEGSCQCGVVTFSLEAPSPVPFMHCYCSICRKTAGSGGYAINLGGDFKTLRVRGKKNIGIHHAVLREPGERPKRSVAERHFCQKCGSPLWVWDPRWPELVHPHASAIDTPLPEPPEVVEAGLDYAAPWVRIPAGRGHRRYGQWPDESLADWHKRHGLWEGPESEA